MADKMDRLRTVVDQGPTTSPASIPRARLQVVHRSRMFRECLKAVLSVELSIDVSDVDPQSIVDATFDELLLADVILVDAGLPARFAIELIERVRQKGTSTKVLAVVSTTAQEMVTECIVAGAHGCIFEESSLEDLRAAIEGINSRGTFCSQDMIQLVFTRFAEIARESQLRRWVEAVDLTSRELEILKLISFHLGNKQIAKRLSISLHTVKNHVHNILEKLKLTSRFEAVDYARKQQWISLSTEEKAKLQPPATRVKGRPDSLPDRH